LSYNDGVRRIYLYADGRNNLESLKKRGIQVFANGQNMQEMIKYICHSTSAYAVNQATTTLDDIVNRVRKDQGVEMLYDVRLQEENLRLHQELEAYFAPIFAQKDEVIADMSEAIAEKDETIAKLRAELSQLKSRWRKEPILPGL
jgi:uncharacterized coiled-coil protein SlyX